jgi:hypothetical protein
MIIKLLVPERNVEVLNDGNGMSTIELCLEHHEIDLGPALTDIQDRADFTDAEKWRVEDFIVKLTMEKALVRLIHRE